MDSDKNNLENTIEQPEETNEVPTLTRYQRYHALNREKRINYQLERYHNDPKVIAKREAREKAKAEREAEQQRKRLEKERIREERIKIAIASKKKSIKANVAGGLESFLENP